jgi:hypothetical protein
MCVVGIWVLRGSDRGGWGEGIDFFLSPACGVEPGAFFFLLDFRFFFSFFFFF